jgi:hypothetical protein
MGQNEKQDIAIAITKSVFIKKLIDVWIVFLALTPLLISQKDRISRSHTLAKLPANVK